MHRLPPCHPLHILMFGGIVFIGRDTCHSLLPWRINLQLHHDVVVDLKLVVVVDVQRLLPYPRCHRRSPRESIKILGTLDPLSRDAKAPLRLQQPNSTHQTRTAAAACGTSREKQAREQAMETWEISVLSRFAFTFGFRFQAMGCGASVARTVRRV
jgi:hypothetical protein